ncbi:hypothetical protein PAXRUDRAFT_823517 [Paxillus rubicundulus Ve08.2h10]|uniref:Uncharacterized protein n=1 Tax=Paxillus rubicundulus Ve08.2h10 TaxID=930991 RepID=A0A0D0EC46_9AGAM|nr:hypothetical protein PAXRUDRAFT_823517 [Paxillus rubicundulus Ve08.2h10]
MHQCPSGEPQPGEPVWLCPRNSAEKSAASQFAVIPSHGGPTPLPFSNQSRPANRNPKWPISPPMSVVHEGVGVKEALHTRTQRGNT